MSKRPGILSILTENADTPVAAPERSITPRPTSSAARSWASDIGELATEAAKAVKELDPALVDRSFLSDRIETEIDPGFDDLKERIRVEGQTVPILVRPHPSVHGRYEVAYGHRRLRACKELGKKVIAQVREMTNNELLKKQIEENSGRADLTFVERAVLVRKLIALGWSQDTVVKQVGLAKSDVSVMNAVGAIPEDIVNRVGPAPKIGRPRWSKLAKSLDDAKSLKIVRARLAQDDIGALDSNARFDAVMTALERKVTSDGSGDVLMDAAGQAIGGLAATRNGIKITISDPRFAALLRGKLEEMLRAYDSRADEGKEEIASKPRKQRRKAA